MGASDRRPFSNGIMAVTESTNEEEYLPSSDRLPRGEVPNEADRIARSLELARAAAVTASENAGRDIVVLDVREQSTMFVFLFHQLGSS